MFKKKDVWESILKILKDEGFIDIGMTRVQVEQKWKNITKKYRDVMDNNSTIGHRRKTCPFFEEIHKVLGKKQIVQSNVMRSISNCVVHPDCSKTTESAFTDNVSDKSDIYAPEPKRMKRKPDEDEVLHLLKMQMENQAQAMSMMKKMHEDNMKLFNNFLDIFKDKK